MFFFFHYHWYTGLLCLDLLSERDVFCAVSLRDKGIKNDTNSVDIDPPDIVWDKLDADFEIMSINYYLEQEQPLRFDVDGISKESHHDFTGSMTAAIREIIDAPLQPNLLSNKGSPSKDKQTNNYQITIVSAEQADDPNSMQVPFDKISFPQMNSSLSNKDTCFRICSVEDNERRCYELSEYYVCGESIHQSQTIKHKYNQFKRIPFEIDDFIGSVLLTNVYLMCVVRNEVTASDNIAENVLKQVTNYLHQRLNSIKQCMANNKKDDVIIKLLNREVYIVTSFKQHNEVFVIGHDDTRDIIDKRITIKCYSVTIILVIGFLRQMAPEVMASGLANESTTNNDHSSW